MKKAKSFYMIKRKFQANLDPLFSQFFGMGNVHVVNVISRSYYKRGIYKNQLAVNPYKNCAQGRSISIFLTKYIVQNVLHKSVQTMHFWFAFH